MDNDLMKVLQPTHYNKKDEKNNPKPNPIPNLNPTPNILDPFALMRGSPRVLYSNLRCHQFPTRYLY